ncbi:CsbD family protein [Labrys sp. 22185]|uniref:CsbD family protein n=1 Tax=Labrys sp. 22185 TaxID=3453888 RepID=UPI003F85B04E
MNSTTDKVKGIANKVAGSVKEGVGKAVGNQEMEAEGAIQKAKGEIQEAKGKVKDAVKSVIDKA